MRGHIVPIEVSLQRGKVAKTIPLYQYDYGQRLVITNIDLPYAYEVHFSNEMHGDAITQLGDPTGVDIPDPLLATGLPVYLWAYFHETGDDGETEYAGVIPVIKRAEPSDQEPTPTERTIIGEAIEALNAGVSEVESIAEGISQTIDEALQEAKNSGEFDGFSPVVTITEITGGHEVTITDAVGDHEFDVLDGEKGDTGDTGATPELAIGTVQTLDPDDPATVTITGTVDNPVLNFGIPQGEPGDATIDDTSTANNRVWSAQKTNNLKSAFVNVTDDQYLHLYPVGANAAVSSDGTYTSYSDGKRWVTEPISTDNLHHFYITKRVSSTYIAAYDSSGTFISRTQITNAIAPANTKTDIKGNFGSTWKYVRYMVIFDSATTDNTFLSDLEISYETNLRKLTHTRFSTVSEMAAAELLEGMKVETLGYYSAGDGGGGLYEITNTSDGLMTISVGGGLYARHLFDGRIDIRQLGFVADDNTQNIVSVFSLINSLSTTAGKPWTLFIPYGTWYTQGFNFTCKTGVNIVGESAKAYIREGYNTVIRPYSDSQNYIFKVGNDTAYTPTEEGDERTRQLDSDDICSGYLLDNLAFAGDVAAAAVTMCGVAYSKFGDIEFREIDKGSCLSLSACWEINFGRMYFRNIYSYQPCILFDQIPYVENLSVNISALYFDYLSFEGINGNGIETTDYSFATGNEFNVIDIEQRWAKNKEGDSVSATYVSREAAEEAGASNFKNHYIFNGYFDNTTVNSVNAYITARIYKKRNSDPVTWHLFKAIFSDSVSVRQDQQRLAALRNMMTVAILSINYVADRGNDFAVVYSRNTNYGGVSSLTIACLTSYEYEPNIYDSNNGMILNVGIITGRRGNVLNTLMNKQYINPRVAGYNSITLLTANDSVDISGCVLKVNNTTNPTMCIKGAETVTLWLRVATISGNSFVDVDSCNVEVKTYDGFSGNQTHDTFTFEYTGGIKKIQITDLDFLTDQYMKVSHTADSGYVMIYRVDFN